MDKTELRRAAHQSTRRVARVIAERISADDAWRLLLAASLEVALIELGDGGTADALRDIADAVESGVGVPRLN